MGSEPRAAIEALIPHRAPFLFVDRLLERGEDRLVTEWDVVPELDCFRGHYPGAPILPGVLVCEFVFQSAAILLAEAGGTAQAGAIPMLTKIEDARFKQAVRPGETLRAEVTLVERVGPARYVSAHVRSNGKTVLRIRFTVALATPIARAAAEEPATERS